MEKRKLKAPPKDSVLRLVLTAMFAAICFVVLMFRIPIADQFVHAGNAVCILAALLLGGWQGGLAGAIGMGLNDLFFYPSSVIKTLVLKLGIGLFTGLIFHYGRTHPNRSPRVGLGVAVGCFAGKRGGSAGNFPPERRLRQQTADPQHFSPNTRRRSGRWS